MCFYGNMPDIAVILTIQEAKQLFFKHKDTIREQHPWTGKDELGHKETQTEYVYQWMGCGRTSWGVHWEDLPKRVSKLLQKLRDRYPKSHGDLIFCAEKEVYPPKFLVKMY